VSRRLRSLGEIDEMPKSDDVPRAARGMIANHGRCAAREAEKRAQNLFGSWWKIAEAIHRMTDNKPEGRHRERRRPPPSGTAAGD
jgi:hypothetical protein